MGLTNKQRVFVETYLETWNATEAALKAGYSEKSARQIGSENLTKPNIKAEIKMRLDAMVMSADETLVSLSKIARGSMDDFIDIVEAADATDSDDIVLNFSKAKRRDSLDLIKKIEHNKYGLKVELYDKQTALNTLAKHHGLLKERFEIDINLIVATIEALDKLGQDPKEIFNEIIARAATINASS